MRPAAQAWEEDFAERLQSIGFERGKSAPTTFFRRSTGCRCVVHGDDFTFCGLGEDLRWIRGLMESWFEIKVRGVLGPDPGDQKEVTILGRKVVWGEGGITYEADPKHRELILECFGFARGANNPNTTATRRSTRMLMETRRWQRGRRRSLGEWQRGRTILA